MKNFDRTILLINAEKETYEFQEIPLNICKIFLGGRGIASYYIYNSIHNPWNHPESNFLIFKGSLIDNLSPLSNGTIIMGKSPITNGVASDNFRGMFSFHMGAINICGIIITGKFKNITGISIDKNKVFFNYIDSYNQNNIFNQKFRSNFSYLRTKPSAFKGVSFANISIDDIYSEGRSGLGTIMGDKSILYISIKKYPKKIFPVSEKLKVSQNNLLRLIYANPILTGESGFSRFGTLPLLHLINARRMLPVNNFKKTSLPDKLIIQPDYLINTFKLKSFSCYNCPIKCLRIKNKTSMNYDSIASFIGLIKDTKNIINALTICSQKGIDPISAAKTIETFKENNKKHLSDNSILKLLLDISESIGIGNELKKGSYEYAKQKSNINSSISIKKLELPPYDPRGAYGIALSFCTSSKGPSIEDAFAIGNEILRKPTAIDRFSFEGKARVIKRLEDEGMIYDSLGLCHLLKTAIPLDEIAVILSETLNSSFSSYDLKQIGERIFYNERILNYYCGFTSKDDSLPNLFFEENGTSTNFMPIKKIVKKDFLKERANYYKIRKLNVNGNPIRNEAEKLKLRFNEL